MDAILAIAIGAVCGLLAGVPLALLLLTRK